MRIGFFYSYAICNTYNEKKLYVHNMTEKNSFLKTEQVHTNRKHRGCHISARLTILY